MENLQKQWIFYNSISLAGNTGSNYDFPITLKVATMRKKSFLPASFLPFLIGKTL